MTCDHGLCPLDSHKPLIKAKPVFAAAQTFLRKASRLDRNFKCFCAVSFVWLIGFCAVLAARLLSLEFTLIWARLNKKNKKLPQFVLRQLRQLSFFFILLLLFRRQVGYRGNDSFLFRRLLPLPGQIR